MAGRPPRRRSDGRLRVGPGVRPGRDQGPWPGFFGGAQRTGHNGGRSEQGFAGASCPDAGQRREHHGGGPVCNSNRVPDGDCQDGPWGQVAVWPPGPCRVAWEPAAPVRCPPWWPRAPTACYGRRARQPVAACGNAPGSGEPVRPVRFDGAVPWAPAGRRPPRLRCASTLAGRPISTPSAPTTTARVALGKVSDLCATPDGLRARGPSRSGPGGPVPAHLQMGAWVLALGLKGRVWGGERRLPWRHGQVTGK